MGLKYSQKKLAKVAKKFHLRFVILHGSYISHQTHPESDLDVAVVGKARADFDTVLKLYGEIDEVFDRHPGELDLKSLDQADPFFRHEVVQSGELLYGDPTDYEDYKAAVYRAYDDAKPLFELEQILSDRYQRHLNKTYAQQAVHPKKN